MELLARIEAFDLHKLVYPEALEGLPKVEDCFEEHENRQAELQKG